MEKEAEGEIRRAKADALKLLEEAEGKAQAFIVKARRDAEVIREKGVQRGREEGEKEAQGIKEGMKRERDELRLWAEGRMDKAVALVIERVFG